MKLFGIGKMSQADMSASLVDVKEALHAQFPGPGATERLGQFDYHITTAVMAIEALFEESIRMEGYK